MRVCSHLQRVPRSGAMPNETGIPFRIVRAVKDMSKQSLSRGVAAMAERLESYISGMTYAICPDRVKPTVQYGTGAPSAL